jgi:hypothetical protein
MKILVHLYHSIDIDKEHTNIHFRNINYKILNDHESVDSETNICSGIEFVMQKLITLNDLNDVIYCYLSYHRDHYDDTSKIVIVKDVFNDVNLALRKLYYSESSNNSNNGKETIDYDYVKTYKIHKESLIESKTYVLYYETFPYENKNYHFKFLKETENENFLKWPWESASEFYKKISFHYSLHYANKNLIDPERHCDHTELMINHKDLDTKIKELITIKYGPEMYTKIIEIINVIKKDD